MSKISYRLRCQIFGHEADVRSISTITEFDGLISGSRDRTARIWRPLDQHSFEQRAVLKNHTNYVIATCYVPPSELFPDGLIVTGGNDKTICIYSAKLGTHLYTLEGHSMTVSCLSYVEQTDYLLSGSWDCTGRIWSLSSQRCLETLAGHEKAVWAIISMTDAATGSKMILTGSADTHIFAWQNQSRIRVYQGHTGCVRSLVVLNSDEFLSSANDNTIKRWHMSSGRCLQTYEGHTNFVYSISLFNIDHFASVSEDRCVRLWSIKESQPIQTIRLPPSTIWSVCSLTNGDIAVGCSDGRIFVFTNDESRMANQQDIAAFEEELASCTVQVKTGDLGEVKIDDLPTEEALRTPGKRDGQTTMINKGQGHVEAYQWSQLDQRWMKIGDVVGSADSTNQGQASATGDKILFEGKYYDYVFNVALDENSLKLPYNINEDPWFAAQAFIHRHELNQLFLDQIAQFIIENTKGMVIDQQASDFKDPFTGTGRYVPTGSSSQNTGTVPGSYDPFTGSGRYVPDRQSSSKMMGSATSQDPFTGSGRYVPNGGAAVSNNVRPPSASQSTVLNASKTSDINLSFPQTNYTVMNSADIAKILGKMKEFNASMSVDAGQLSEKQFQNMNDLLNGNIENLEEKVNAVFQTLQWPVDKIFPSLDVIRLIVLNGDICKYLLRNETKANEFFNQLLSYVPSEQSANTMLIFRTFTNLFSNDLGEKYLVSKIRAIVPKTLICLPSSKKFVQLALTNVILNYCVYAYKKNDPDISQYLYDCYREVVDVQIESESAKRLLLGLGTLLYTNADLVLDIRTKSDNSAKQFFSSLELLAKQFDDETLDCLERCRALSTTL